MLKGTHLPVEVKEIQVGYLHSPYFKDIYQYLLQNTLLSSKLAIKKLEALSEKYVLLDSLLFRIHVERETAVLAIPETCADKIITLYHKCLFAGHQGVIKTYLTISDKFFIPNLIYYLRSHIKVVIYANYLGMKSHLLDIFTLGLTQIMYQSPD